MWHYSTYTTATKLKSSSSLSYLLTPLFYEFILQQLGVLPGKVVVLVGRCWPGSLFYDCRPPAFILISFCFAFLSELVVEVNKGNYIQNCYIYLAMFDVLNLEQRRREKEKILPYLSVCH